MKEWSHRVKYFENYIKDWGKKGKYDSSLFHKIIGESNT